jgi:hypothetical protein
MLPQNHESEHSKAVTFLHSQGHSHPFGRVPMTSGLPLQTDIVIVRQRGSNVPVVPNVVRRLLAYPSVQATVERYDRPREVGRLV